MVSLSQTQTQTQSSTTGGAATATTANKSPTTPEIYHALLLPAITQILRAQGYYASTPGAVDVLTELAASYAGAIAGQAARHAALNSGGGLAAAGPTVVDVRMALEDCGALWPQRDFAAEEFAGGEEGEEEDTRGVDEFLRWARGRKNQRIRRVAGLHRPAVAGAEGVGEVEAGGVVEEEQEQERVTDYLSALKKKHNRSDQQDSKYAGTILGRGIEHGEVNVEGGNADSLQAWAKARLDAAVKPPGERLRELEKPEGTAADAESRPPSSGLSSLADDDVEMMDMN